MVEAGGVVIRMRIGSVQLAENNSAQSAGKGLCPSFLPRGSWPVPSPE